MMWHLSKQFCITTALAAVMMVSFISARSVVAEESLTVPERTWQGIPGLERTAGGRVFVSWFTGGPAEPAPENTVVLAYSDDEGKTFTEPRAIAVPSGGTRCFDPALWIDPHGRLWYLFNRGNKSTAVHDVHARICDDPDANPPVFDKEFRVGFDVPYAFRLNKITVLSSGEWIMPVTLAEEPIHKWFAGPKQLQGVGISTDQGKTWKLHGAVKAPEWALECMITELRDGRLWMLIRTGSGVLWQSYSTDKGRTWSEGSATTIASPGARFFVLRLSSGNLLLVNHFKFKGRSHLTARISEDDGVTWNEGLLLDERSSVSYPDGVQDCDGLIWITYDRDRQGAGDVLFATFREKDVIAGKDVSGEVRLKQKVDSLDDNWSSKLENGGQFRKMVPLVLAGGIQARVSDPNVPVVITNPGAEFQDDVRPGAIIIGMDRTPDGRIWGCWTGTGDKKDGYFLLATSDDDGRSWSKPRLAVGARTDATQKLSGALVGNLWTDPKGRLWLFFDQQLGNPDNRITNWFIRCDDPDAAEPMWSDPVMFAEGCTLNKPTVLNNGDWLLPVSDWHKKTARVFASTDQGVSWNERGNLKFPGWEFDEHMMVELKDGRLWMLARTHGQPHESFSTDNGVTWSEPRQAKTVQNVNARFFLRRLKSGRILLVKNGSPAERLGKRTHMSAYLSEDDGQTWKGGLLLDERNAVSYPDGFESPDGLIHILYDWNRHTEAEILMAKFREEDVLAGKIVSKDAQLRMLANKATGPKPEELYNGIELPDIWPPRFGDPNSSKPMEVPYLQHPPKVIPINDGRQLFVDEFLIESTDMKRVFHQAEKFAGNPVFKAETAVEKDRNGVVYLGQGGVFFDPSEQLFKMFYSAGLRGPLALATSPDLKTWTRPELGLHGGNFLLPEGAAWGMGEGAAAGSDNALWYDINATDPKQRIKYLTCWIHVPKEQLVPGLTHSLQVSDGVTWSKPTVCNAPAGDYGSIFYNPFRSKWVQSIRGGGPRGRSRYYVESDRFLDGADWSKMVYWTNADRLDRPEPAGAYADNASEGDPPQLYSLAAVAYESLMIGMHQIHRGPKNEICDKGKFLKLTDLELGFSRDGFHWDRPDRTGFIRGERKQSSWDRGYLHTTTGVFVMLDDKLVFPYCAYSGDVGDGRQNSYGGGAIGLASLRRDGFASMEAVDKPGTLTTRSVTFRGRHLFVNVNAPQGELRAELLDPSGKVLATSKPVTGDTTKQRIEWLEQPDLAKWSGQRVRFRFQLSNGQFYSFWVTEDAGGASNGYVGAGGPDFPGVRDVVSKE